MLKLRLEQGEALERTVEAAARQLEKLLEAAINQGYLRISAYPRPDSVITAAALFAMAASLNINAIVRVNYRPPAHVEIPTVLIGYQSLNYKTQAVAQPLLAIASSIQSPPPPGATYVEGDGSAASIAALIVDSMKMGVIRVDVLRSLLLASQYGGYIDSAGRPHGLDKILYEAARGEALGLEEVLSLKAYKPSTLTVCESLSITLDPPYPGITGRRDSCVELLRGEGLGGLAERRLSSLDDDEVEKLAVAVLAYIRDRLGGEINAQEYVGAVPVLSKDRYIDDIRMMAHFVLYAMEAAGDVGPALSLASSPETTAGPLERFGLSLVAPASRAIDEAEGVRYRLRPWLRSYKYVGPRLPHTLAWRILTVTGRIEPDALLLAETDGGLCTSVFQAEAALGMGAVKKLVETRTMRLEGMKLCAAPAEE